MYNATLGRFLPRDPAGLDSGDSKLYVGSHNHWNSNVR